MRFARPALAGVPVGIAWLVLCGGCAGGHAQVGPMIGYSFKRGVTLGWEAGAGAAGLVRVSTGGSYRLTAPKAPAPPTPDADSDSEEGRETSPKVAPDYFHYLAFEPLGLTVGFAFPNTGGMGFLGGVWAGWMLNPSSKGVFRDTSDPNPFTPNFDCPDYDPEPGFLLSGAVGLRYMGSEWEVYFTPKAVLVYCVEYAN